MACQTAVVLEGGVNGCSRVTLTHHFKSVLSNIEVQSHDPLLQKLVGRGERSPSSHGRRSKRGASDEGSGCAASLNTRTPPPGVAVPQRGRSRRHPRPQTRNHPMIVHERRNTRAPANLASTDQHEQADRFPNPKIAKHPTPVPKRAYNHANLQPMWSGQAWKGVLGGTDEEKRAQEMQGLRYCGGC